MDSIDPKTSITLTVSVQEANVLIAGLGKLPLEVAAELWLKVRGQAAEQLPPPHPLPDDLQAE